MNTLEKKYSYITESNLFTLDGHDIDLPLAIIDLCDAIEEASDMEEKWYLGEHAECTLDNFIIGAHWALSEWHGGQSSESYAALCATGSIFSPGMACGPEEGSSEEIAYDMVCQWFEDHK